MGRLLGSLKDLSARAARLSSHGAGSNGISPQNADLFTGPAISVFCP
jgi:hypothetical protein